MIDIGDELKAFIENTPELMSTLINKNTIVVKIGKKVTCFMPILDGVVENRLAITINEGYECKSCGKTELLNYLLDVFSKHIWNTCKKGLTLHNILFIGEDTIGAEYYISRHMKDYLMGTTRNLDMLSNQKVGDIK